MRRRRSLQHQLGLAVLLVAALGVCYAQADSDKPAEPKAGATASQAPEEFDYPMPEQPSDSSSTGERSFLLPGLHLSQSLDSKLDGSSAAGPRSVTRALGSLDLIKMWKRFRTSVDYVGGGAFSSEASTSGRQLHELQVNQKFLWRNGQLGMRDSFSYLPEGSFGAGSFGGATSYEASGLGSFSGGFGTEGTGEGSLGFEQFGALGQDLRVSNVTSLDISEALTSRSVVTMAGAFGLLHFVNNKRGLIDTQLVSVQASFGYRLNRRDEIAFVSGFQDFHYPRIAAGSFTSYAERALYTRHVSARMDLMVGGGPQFLVIQNPQVAATRRITGSGFASLSYHLSRTNLSLSYSRRVTSGSGFFAGATSDIARLTATRHLALRWEAEADVGYAHSTRIEPIPAGIDARSYQFGYAGGALRREIGRHWRAFVSYQFNGIDFPGSACSNAGAACGSFAQRHAATMGLDWHPLAIRLD